MILVLYLSFAFGFLWVQIEQNQRLRLLKFLFHFFSEGLRIWGGGLVKERNKRQIQVFIVTFYCRQLCHGEIFDVNKSVWELPEATTGHLFPGFLTWTTVFLFLSISGETFLLLVKCKRSHAMLKLTPFLSHLSSAIGWGALRTGPHVQSWANGTDLSQAQLQPQQQAYFVGPRKDQIQFLLEKKNAFSPLKREIWRGCSMQVCATSLPYQTTFQNPGVGFFSPKFIDGLQLGIWHLRCRCKNSLSSYCGVFCDRNFCKDIWYSLIHRFSAEVPAPKNETSGLVFRSNSQQFWNQISSWIIILV